jgi:hypothetical protein
MKATHNKSSEGKVEWKFPCLGFSEKTGNVILFTEKSTGTIVVDCEKIHGVGYHNSYWQMKHFTPLPSTESVTLQND